MTRYFVQSEQVRGEPRIYWICDRQRRCEQVGLHTRSERTAENRCERLNAEASVPSPAHRPGEAQ